MQPLWFHIDAPFVCACEASVSKVWHAWIRGICTTKLVVWRHLQRHCLSNRNRVNLKLGWPAHELGVGCHDFDLLISSWKGQMLHLVICDQPFNQRLFRLFRTYFFHFGGSPRFGGSNGHLQLPLYGLQRRVKVSCVFPDQNQKFVSVSTILSLSWQWGVKRRGHASERSTVALYLQY